jgi:RNA polymerase sigma factor (sigma-70 family)|tara:strand:+ start:1087 stop:1464 length:378 start_codon:yes stop_codon:yes gene_type:complete
MAKFDPFFWEVLLDPSELDRFEALPEYNEETAAEQEARAAALAEAASLLRQIIESELTDKQQSVLYKYYFDGLSQEQIAEDLGISQQVVSKHLFGVLRNGRKVGGATRKLRKALQQLGIDPQKWV